MRADRAAHVCAHRAAEPVPRGHGKGGHQPGQQPQGSESPYSPSPPRPGSPLSTPCLSFPSRARLRSAAALRDGDSDSTKGGEKRGWLWHGDGFWHSWDCQRAVPAPSCWPPCPGPSPARGGHQPGGDSDPHGEQAVAATHSIPRGQHRLGAPPAPTFPIPGGGPRGRNRPHGSRGDKGGRGPAAEGMSPALGPVPKDQVTQFPGNPSPGAAFPGAGIPAPRGAGGKGRGAAEGARAGGLRGLGEGGGSSRMHPWEQFGGGRMRPKIPLGARRGWMQPKASPGARGG